MTFFGGQQALQGGLSPLAQYLEFQCSSRRGTSPAGSRLMVKPGGAPAELRDIRTNHNYFVYVLFGTSEDNPGTPAIEWNQGIQAGGGWWNGSAWTTLGNFLGWQGGPAAGANAGPFFKIDGGAGVIQIQQSVSDPLRYCWAHVRILGAPYDVTNFPEALVHLP